MRSSSLTLPGSTLLGALALFFMACSDGSSDDSDADGDGGTHSGSGGLGSVGDGDGPGGTGARSGSGGSGEARRIPGTDHYSCEETEGERPTLELVDIATGFDRAVLVTHAPNDRARLFVVDQGGTIHIVKDGTKNTEPFLSITGKVTRANDEQGLLGLAFHPAFEDNGLFYLHYSAASGLDAADEGDTIIEEYEVSNDPDLADAASARRVLRVDQPPSSGPTSCPSGNGSNHNGGTIAFGGDDHLYIALGDGGGYNDCFENAQDETSLLGKILRIDPRPSGGDAYSTPADNLIRDRATAAPEIWDMGLRNPYRMNFDACTMALYIGDVGQNNWEEVNIEPAGQGRRNYGWPIMEGTHCRVGTSCDRTGLTLPLIDYARPASFGSVIGGAVYRGSELPALRGTYFYADINSRFWSTRFDGENVSTPEDLSDDLAIGSITSIQNGGDGEIYITTFSAVKKLSAAR